MSNNVVAGIQRGQEVMTTKLVFNRAPIQRGEQQCRIPSFFGLPLETVFLESKDASVVNYMRELAGLVFLVLISLGFHPTPLQ